MRINIQTNGFNLTSSIRTFVSEKIKPLEKLIDIENGKFESPTGKKKIPVRAWVELEKMTHHKKGPVFRAECQIELPFDSVRAEAVSDDLRSSIVEVKNELQRELKKIKGKMIAKSRRPGRD